MNWPRFVAEGGSACYVLGSYGLTLLAIGGEVLLLWRRRARHDAPAAESPEKSG